MSALVPRVRMLGSRAAILRPAAMPRWVSALPLSQQMPLFARATQIQGRSLHSVGPVRASFTQEQRNELLKRPLSEPIEAIEARANLDAGNTAEAYGLHPNAGAIGKAGVIEKYGAATLLGFASVIVLSKELFILDAELIVAGCFTAFVTSCYVMLRDQVSSSLQSGVDEIRRELETAYDAAIASVNVQLEQVESGLTVADDSKALVARMKSAFEGLPDAVIRHETAKVNRFTETSLEQLARKEQQMLQQFGKRLVASAHRYVRRNLASANAEMNKNQLDVAIKRLSGEKISADPVRDLYRKYIQNFEKQYKAATSAPITLPESMFKKVKAEYDKAIDALPKLPEDLVDKIQLPPREELPRTIRLNY